MLQQEVDVSIERKRERMRCASNQKRDVEGGRENLNDDQEWSIALPV